MEDDNTIELSDLTPFQRRVLEELAAMQGEAASFQHELGDVDSQGIASGSLASLEVTMGMWLDEEHSYLVELDSRLARIEKSMTEMTTQMKIAVMGLSGARVCFNEPEGSIERPSRERLRAK